MPVETLRVWRSGLEVNGIAKGIEQQKTSLYRLYFY
jgi:hypothetical protein